MTLDLESGVAAIEDEELREKVGAIMSNSRLSERFLALARDLDVMEARAPEDVGPSSPSERWIQQQLPASSFDPGRSQGYKAVMT